MTDAARLAAEQRARALIDEQLQAAGWVVQDGKAMNLFAGQGIAVREVVMAPGHGRVDYLLYVDKRVVGVIEAKPIGTTLSGVEWQSAMYATGLPESHRRRARLVDDRLPFVFEASGSETHFTNGFDPDPRSRKVFAFPKPSTLARILRDADADPERPTWRAKARALPPLDVAGLRPAQIVAINGVEQSLAEQRFDRSLIQMATAARDDQLVWDQNASRKPIGMLLGEPMRNGHSARALSGDGPGVRTLTLTAITRRSFTDTYTKMTVANRDRVQDLWLKPGDVLVQRANTPELVGTSALYEGPEGWAIFPDLAIRLRANQAIIRPRYLALALQANKTHTALRGKAKGLAGSMPKIDQRAVAECEIPVPSLSAQDRILREAEGVHEVTDQLQREVVKSLKRSANLRRALLSAAFSGRSPADTEMGRFFIDGPSEQEVLAG